jgi:predicted dehydrogenase
MSEKVHTAAIVGLGRIGSLLDDPWADAAIRDESWRLRPCTHAGLLTTDSRIRLVAGAEIDAGRREAFTRRWGVRAYADHHEMLDRERPDIVSVCTRAADRCAPTLDAIAAGARALLLEKHLSATLDEADAMVAAVERAKIPAVVNFTFRFYRPVQALADVVRGGRIGDLRTIVCYPGPLMVHSGAHFFDLCRFFGAGDPVRAVGRLEGDPDVGDPPGSAYIEFATGVRAYVDARARATHGYMEIHGTTGIARVGNDADAAVGLWTVPPPAAPADAFYQRPPQPMAWTPPVDEEGSIRAGRNVTRRCIDDVVACLDEGGEGRGPIASIRDGLWAQEVAAAIHTSHRLGGRPVDIPVADRGLRLNAI